LPALVHEVRVEPAMGLYRLGGCGGKDEARPTGRLELEHLGHRHVADAPPGHGRPYGGGARAVQARRGAAHSSFERLRGSRLSARIERRGSSGLFAGAVPPVPPCFHPPPLLPGSRSRLLACSARFSAVSRSVARGVSAGGSRASASTDRPTR